MGALYIPRRELIATMYKQFHRLPLSTLSSSTHSNTSQHTIEFSGKSIETTVSNQASQVENWISQIDSLYPKTPLIVGMDCEWKPNWVKGKINKVAILQLCVENKCLVLHLLHMDYLPLVLKEFLLKPNVSFVGVGLRGDVTKIKKDHELDCSCIVDISLLARKTAWCSAFKGGPLPCLKGLALEILGVNMAKSKEVTLSNWEARVLSQDQIKYACVDAYVSYQIGCRLLKES